jgi:capsular exopolysaccharide synthesis family protein
MILCEEMAGMSKGGVLDERLKAVLTANTKELSSVEGNLLSVAKRKDIKTIFITSCNTSEGKTISAISMAYALATHANAKVLLIDGNLHSPMIHELFSVEPAPGLADLLLFAMDFTNIIRDTEFERFVIMPCGSDVFNKLEVFESEVFKKKLTSLRQSFDYIIVDGHAVFGSSDPAHIAGYFDGIIFVVESEKTKWEVLQSAKEKISNAGGNILGVVLNKRKYPIPEKLYEKI